MHCSGFQPLIKILKSNFDRPYLTRYSKKWENKTLKLNTAAMDTRKIEERLKILRKNHGRYALLIILTVPNGTIAPGSYLVENQEIIKREIKNCLPDLSTTTMKEMAKKSHELSNLMKEKIEDKEISSKLQALIEVASKEHAVDLLSSLLDELKKKQQVV